MKLKKAEKRFHKIENVPFKELFSSDEISKISRDKGKSGKLLELALGLKNTNKRLDFKDGELKSNKCTASGKPKETIFITQISGMIDDLIAHKPFESTCLYKKVKNLLYVPVCKDGKPGDWMFLPCIHVKLKHYHELRDYLRADYDFICRQVKDDIECGEMGTVSGDYIQIRTKDSKPYHPIYSNTYGRNVSNKNRAFYFKKNFVYYIRENIV